MDLNFDEQCTLLSWLRPRDAIRYSRVCQAAANAVRQHGPTQRAIRAEFLQQIVTRLVHEHATRDEPNRDAITLLRPVIAGLAEGEFDQLVDIAIYSPAYLIGTNQAVALAALIRAFPERAESVAVRVDNMGKSRHSAKYLATRATPGGLKRQRSHLLHLILRALGDAPPSLYEPFVQRCCRDAYHATPLHCAELRYLSAAQCDRLARRVLDLDAVSAHATKLSHLLEPLSYFSEPMRSAIYTRILIHIQDHPEQPVHRTLALRLARAHYDIPDGAEHDRWIALSAAYH